MVISGSPLATFVALWHPSSFDFLLFFFTAGSFPHLECVLLGA